MLDVTPAARAQAFLDRFGEALAKPDIDAAVAMYLDFGGPATTEGAGRNGGVGARRSVPRVGKPVQVAPDC